MVKRILAMTLVSLFVSTAVSVQSASASSKPDKQARFIEKVRAAVAKLGAGKEAIVEVRLRDKSRLSGYVSEAGEDGFVVTNEAAQYSVPVAYTNVAQVKGHNLSTGAKIAIGIGIGVGIALIVLAIYIHCCTG